MRICKGIVLSFCIVLCVFPFVSFAAGEVTLVPFSSGVSISADTAGMGGSGTFTDIGSMSIIEGGVGNIKSGTITITAPVGFEFDTTNPATVTVTSSTSNPETNINHLVSGTIAPTITTAGAISFTVTSQSTSARNTLTWNSVNIRPIDVVSIPSSDIILSSTDNIIGLALPVVVGSVSETYVPSEPVAGTLIENVTINTDTVWTKAGNPYVIGPHVILDVGSTLTIGEGVHITISAPYDAPMLVRGTIFINGTKVDPVTITTDTQNTMMGQQAFVVNNSGKIHARWMSCTVIFLCINQSEGGEVYIDHGDFSYFSSAITYGPFGVIDVRNSYFRHGSGSAIFGSFGYDSSRGGNAFSAVSATIHVTQNYFEDIQHGTSLAIIGGQGLTDSNISYIVENNTLKNMPSIAADFGGYNLQTPITVGANYYGHPTGPREPSNPGGLGVTARFGPDSIVMPFLTTEVFPNDDDDTPPADEEEIEPLPTCCSSVMFFPGIEGSRLYMKRDNGSEDQLWEPNIPADVADLYANTDGNSVNDVYARDIIKETNLGPNIPQVRKKIYKSFSDDLDNLVSNNTIHEWQPVPYDWRMSVDDIVNGGVVLENDTNNIVTQVEQMAQASDTGKVNLVGHSNGGLMIKYLVKKLEDSGKASLVDSVVLVGSPQTGTPKGAIAVLNGINFDGFLGVLAPQKYNKELALNIAGAYALIPSEKFFENNVTPVVQFDSSVGDFAGLIHAYGNNIDTYQELKDFVLSNNDDRSIPGFDYVDMPAIGNEVLYAKADSLHTIIDTYTIPSPIKIYEISGTGLPTVSGITYSRNKHCFLDMCTDRQFLVPQTTMTVDGDNVVLNRSSAVLGGTRYYVDMNTYNKNNNVNYDHAHMLENNSVKSLIKNIITDTPSEVPYVISKDARPKIKTKRISMHSPVNISVYDSQGRHTGPCVDPEYLDMVCVDEEIPNSSYVAMGEDKYINIPGDGVYTLKLDGYDAGTFTLNIDNYEDDTMVDGVLFADIPTTADTAGTIDLTNLPQEILLDNNNDNDPDIRVDSNSQVTDLHPQVVTTQSVQNNIGGRPLPAVLVVQKEQPSTENKKTAVQIKKKNVIIKKPVQVASKQTPVAVSVVKIPSVINKPVITFAPIVIPMKANVADVIDFGLWDYLEELFKY